MPHINQTQRSLYTNLIYELSNVTIDNKGDLEFIIYNVLKQYMKSREKRYSTYHDAVYGGIHACEEYKRLYLDKREDKAISENGEA